MSQELNAAIWGAILGAISGGIVSFFLDNIKDSKRRRTLIVDQFKDVAFDFNAYVQTYWSIDSDNKLLEASIISCFNKIQAKLSQLGIDPITDTSVRLLMKEIYQISTGGSFATTKHKADQLRVRNVHQRIESLVSVVMVSENHRR